MVLIYKRLTPGGGGGGIPILRRIGMCGRSFQTITLANMAILTKVDTLKIKIGKFSKKKQTYKLP